MVLKSIKDFFKALFPKPKSRKQYSNVRYITKKDIKKYKKRLEAKNE